MTDQISHIDWLGAVVLAIVFGSLLLVVLAAILGRPWKPKVTLVFIGTLLTLLVVVVAGTWIGGHIFSLLMG